MTNTQVTNGIYGTKTYDNLMHAFEREAHNHTRAMIYADIASDEKNSLAASRFRQTADNDKRLAELWLSYVDELGNTPENLEYLAAHKDSLKDDIYPAMALDAEDDGFYEIAEKMRLASMSKDSQTSELRGENSVMDGIMTLEEPPVIMHKCMECGYVVGGEKPDRCPLCSYPWQSLDD